MKKLILSLTAFLCAGTLVASSIASESFATPDGYVSGTAFGNVDQNRTNLVGTTGFSANDQWQRNTVLVTPRDTDSLTHDLMVGSAAAGSARIRPPDGSTIARASYRALAAEPSGSTFFMSGLVSMLGDAENLHSHSDAQMGLSTMDGFNDQVGDNNYLPGFFLGLSRAANGDVHLAAFADGNTYTLGNALTGATLGGGHMIVLRAELGQTAGTNDTLTAWYALAGATELTLGGTWSGINIADAGSDLEAFGLRGRTHDASASGVPDGAAFDEWRFGTSLDAVAVPEPGTVGFILGASVFIFLLVRARISK